MGTENSFAVLGRFGTARCRVCARDGDTRSSRGCFLCVRSASGKGTCPHTSNDKDVSNRARLCPIVRGRVSFGIGSEHSGTSSSAPNSVNY